MGNTGYRESVKSDLAYKFIKERIVTGEYSPGDRIVIRDISEQLGISDTPVREALKKLASENLIEMETHKGARITPVNIENLEEIFVVRLELETLACRLAVINATQSEIHELETLVDKMDECIANNDTIAYSIFNTRFHDILYAASHSSVLIDIVKNLYARSEYSRMVFNYDPQRRKASNEEHKAIVEGLKEKDEQKAVTAIRTQKTFGFSAIINALKMSRKKFDIDEYGIAE
jgi:DNA-binding GntR family transcriptional regulator